MIRMFDFDCPAHGTFEVMITTESVPDFFEHACGQIAPRVWRRFNGMQPSDSVHAIELGGRTFRRDDLEEVLDRKNDGPEFYETDSFKDRVMESLSRNAYKEMHGTLAPQAEAPALDSMAEQSLAALPVDPEKVKASNKVIAETMRRTEFKE